MQASPQGTPRGCCIPRSNKFLGIPPLFRRRPRHFDIETPILILAHYGQLLEPILNLNQPLQHIAAYDNLPMPSFAQRLQVRGIQANLLRQTGKELSIYDFPFIHFFILIKFQ